jgi:hypothetical protein
MTPDGTTQQRVYSITLVRTEYAFVSFYADDQGAAEAIAANLAANPELIPTVHVGYGPPVWRPDFGPARLASSGVNDMTDEWARRGLLPQPTPREDLPAGGPCEECGFHRHVEYCSRWVEEAAS